MKAHQPAAPVVHALKGRYINRGFFPARFVPDPKYPCGVAYDPHGLHSPNLARVTCPGCRPARSTAAPAEGAAA